MNQLSDIETKLRKSTKGQLLALKVIANSPPNSMATTSQMQDELYSQVSDSMQTADQSVGGTISSVTRIKFNNKPLLIPMGRDDVQGVRWQLDENLIKKDTLKQLIDEILEAWI